MGLALVNDLAAIEAILQHQVERTAREWLVADEAPRSARPRLAFDPSGFNLVLQQPNRAEFGEAPEEGAHDFRLAGDKNRFRCRTCGWRREGSVWVRPSRCYTYFEEEVEVNLGLPPDR